MTTTKEKTDSQQFHQHSSAEVETKTVFPEPEPEPELAPVSFVPALISGTIPTHMPQRISKPESGSVSASLSPSAIKVEDTCWGAPVQFFCIIKIEFVLIFSTLLCCDDFDSLRKD